MTMNDYLDECLMAGMNLRLCPESVVKSKRHCKVLSDIAGGRYACCAASWSIHLRQARFGWLTSTAILSQES
jgi:hypothetical protein